MQSNQKNSTDAAAGFVCNRIVANPHLEPSRRDSVTTTLSTATSKSIKHCRPKFKYISAASLLALLIIVF